jgi:outer membrane immunogenic protein
MRKVFLGTVAAIVVIGPASAADLPVKAPSAPAPYIASPWDGPYIGVNIGGGETNFRATASDFFGTGEVSQHANGVVGGVQGGYRRQFGNFVFGSETDWSATSIKGTTDGVTTELRWFGTVRATAGFLVTPAVLIYGTGGGAYGRAEVSVPGVSAKVPGVGWAAGAGLQYAFGSGWFIGAEYLHVDLDGPSVSSGGATFSTHAITDLGRARIDYKF